MPSSKCRLVTLAMLAACAGPTPRALPLAAPVEEPRLRPGDAVRVAIDREPQLSGQFAVDETGTVLLPMIGLVRVGDRPFAEVRQMLLEAYGRELVTRDLTITPVLRIPVLGEVRQPGLVAVDPTFTLSDVVAAAGGWGPAARRDRLMVSRGQETYVLELDDERADVAGLLRSGDRLEIGRQSWMRENLSILVGASATVLGAAITSLLLR